MRMWGLELKREPELLEIVYSWVTLSSSRILMWLREGEGVNGRGLISRDNHVVLTDGSCRHGRYAEDEFSGPEKVAPC